MKKLVFFVSLLFSISFGYSQSSDSVLSDKKIAPWFVERFKISAGFFYVVNNTDIQVGITGDPGTPINLEKDVGFNKTIGTFLASAEWRISRRSRFAISYYNINRSSNTILKKDISFEGTIYPINASVSSFFNTSIYQFSYGYAIVSKPTFEVGLSIGAHIVRTKSEISLTGNSGSSSASNNVSFTAPLPDVGIWGGYAFSNRFALNMDISYLTVTDGDYSGRVLSTNFALLYKLADKWNLSLGYTGLNFRYQNIKTNVVENFKWGYNGPALAAIFSFGKKSWGHLPESDF